MFELWAAFATLAAVMSTPSEPPPDDAITIAAVGHLVMGTDFPPKMKMIPADDGVPHAELLAPLLADADIALANFAAPMTAVEKPRVAADFIDIFALRVPPQMDQALARLGLDVVLTTNNHALDFGLAGHEETLFHLARLGIGSVGHVGEIWKKRVRGIEVAVVGFAGPYLPTFQSNRDLDNAASVVAAAKDDADIVIVLVHGGGEGREALHVPRTMEYVGPEPRGRMVAFSRRVVDAGADLVVVFGSHAPRAMEFHQDRLIAYGLGNFWTHGPFDIQSPNHLSLVLRVTLERGGALREARIVPMRLRHPGLPYPDPAAWVVSWLKRYSKADFPDSAPFITREGLLSQLPPAPEDDTAGGQ